jgi:alginate O-acetyltransferase complex protein AlgI
MLPSLRELFQMGTTFLLTVLAWVFFRASSISNALEILSKIVSKDIFSIPFFAGRKEAILTVLLIFSLLTIEWITRKQKYAFANWFNDKIIWQLVLMTMLGIIIWRFELTTEANFIYFQF